MDQDSGSGGSSAGREARGGGSTRCGRDSKAKRLGVKRYDGEKVNAGTIIVRQRGLKIQAFRN